LLQNEKHDYFDPSVGHWRPLKRTNREQRSFWINWFCYKIIKTD